MLNNLLGFQTCRTHPYFPCIRLPRAQFSSRFSIARMPSPRAWRTKKSQAMNAKWPDTARMAPSAFKKNSIPRHHWRRGLDCPLHEGIDRTFQREDMPATGEAGRHISRGENLRKIAADQGTLRRRPFKSITRPATVTSSHVSGSGTAWMARSLPPVKTPPSKSAS